MVSVAILCVPVMLCYYAKCPDVKYHYAECIIFIVMMSEVMLKVIILSVIISSVFMLSVIKLNIAENIYSTGITCNHHLQSSLMIVTYDCHL
jgi:hypothetical protein